MELEADSAEWDAATVAGVLEYLLGSGRLRQDPAARPLSFRLLIAGQPAVQFRPSAFAPLFTAGDDNGDAVAVITAHPDALLGVLLRPGYSPAAELHPFCIDGDPTALVPLVRALSGGTHVAPSQLAVRASKPGRPVPTGR